MSSEATQRLLEEQRLDRVAVSAIVASLLDGSADPSGRLDGALRLAREFIGQSSKRSMKDRRELRLIARVASILETLRGDVEQMERAGAIRAASPHLWDEGQHNGIPDSYWREVPCGHPPDPVAMYNPEGHPVCHCGRGLDSSAALPDTPFGAPGPIVSCDKCGCYVAVPPAAPVSVGDEDEPMDRCDCNIPYLEGAGQHSPGCSVFKTDGGGERG